MIPDALVSPTCVYTVTSVLHVFNEAYVLGCTQVRTSIPVVVRYVPGSDEVALSQVRATFQSLWLLRHPVLPQFIKAFDAPGAACLQEVGKTIQKRLAQEVIASQLGAPSRSGLNYPECELVVDAMVEKRGPPATSFEEVKRIPLGRLELEQWPR
jgi:hypothetical protein